MVYFLCFSYIFFLFKFQNDTEKSASDPGTPPQTSKPSELKSTSKSSPKTSPETPKSPEVTFLFLLQSLSLASVLTSFLAVSRQLLQPTKHRRSKSRTVVTWPRAVGGAAPTVSQRTVWGRTASASMWLTGRRSEGLVTDIKRGLRWSYGIKGMEKGFLESLRTFLVFFGLRI